MLKLFISLYFVKSLWGQESVVGGRLPHLPHCWLRPCFQQESSSATPQPLISLLLHFLAGRYYYLAIGGAVSTYVRMYLERLLQDERLDARLLDVTERLCMLSLQGPLRFPLSLFDMIIHIFCDLKLIWFMLNALDSTFITSNNRILICMGSIIVENYWERSQQVNWTTRTSLSEPIRCQFALKCCIRNHIRNTRISYSIQRLSSKIQ